MVDRQTSEVYERRQIHDRINELKMNCEQLRQTKDDLLVKLRELNEKADQLINDRDHTVKSQVKTDLFGSKSRHSAYQNRDPSHRVAQISSRLVTDDLNNFRKQFSSSPSSHHQDFHAATTAVPIKGRPSNAFKTKISLCLDEVMQKAEQIVELTETMSADKASLDNHRKQQKTTRNVPM